ncbi:long-chain fatty acid transport protein 6 [Aulostomus maculatus]
MISVVLSSLVAGLLALLLYQRMTYPFLWQDLTYYLRLRSYKKTLQARMQQGVVSYLDCFLLQARRTPDKPFILFEDQRLSYRDVDRRSSQFAGAFRDGSVQQGHTVALLMCNEPDFVCVWLGLCKLGCQVAFLNSNIRSAKALLHCLRSCAASTLVVGTGTFTLSPSELASSDVSSVNSNYLFKETVKERSHALFPPSDTPSGSLSKAACVGHLKAIVSMAFFQMCGATSDDIIYITLPLYHMSASLLGVGGCIHLGATCVLKKKFSASQFWKDCVKYNVSVVQYIGELCRYLLNHPKVPEERAHSVRLAAGSGLRADVWREFLKRFGRIKIREGYGLTEASIGFLNYTDEVGAIGRASFFNKLSMPFELLRYDTQTYEPVRTELGRCVRAQTGEAGILVAPLTAVNQFLGYAGNKVQSEKKLLRDVFRPGDVYFNTGDLLLQDHRDFLYFRDRVGDTFRWKGENVSTMEVSEALCHLDFIQEANVYGVSVPGHEGRAGMAAIVLKQHHKLNGPKVYNHLGESLPAYAWPWFLRIQASLDVTETFKQQKVKLVQEGFDPESTQDPLYFLDLSQKDYILLTASLYDDLLSGKIKL